MTTNTKINVMDFVKDLAKIEKTLTVDGTVGGMINEHVALQVVQKDMAELKKLPTKYHSSMIGKAIANAYTANDVVSNEQAISDLEDMCIDDVNNGYFDSNVIDAKQLNKIANSGTRFYVATPSYVKPLTSYVLANVMSYIAYDEDLDKFVDQHF